MKRSVFLAAAAASILTALPTLADTVHFGLARSVPAADATVPAVDEVTLWFTQEPQENSMSIRLLDGAGQPVAGGRVRPNADDGKAFTLGLDDPLAGGTYRVGWRAIGQDGHVVRGDFAFAVGSGS